MEFIFDNLSYLNLDEKCEEFRALLTEECMVSVAQYLVMQRVVTKPNFHKLYSNFLDLLREPVFHKLVMYETVKNIKVRLHINKRTENSSDRCHLRNLGHWLGILTLRRNKPILHIDVDMKNLLIEAYHKGYYELNHVVPFVARVLRNCVNSRVFRPPNPWTMTILNILAELHADPNLKVNLQFEIEVLYNTLCIDITNWTQTFYLNDPHKSHSVDHQLSCDYRVVEMNSYERLKQYSTQSVIELVIETTNIGPIKTQLLPQSAQNVRPRFHYSDITPTNLAHIADFLTINSNVPLFRACPYLMTLVAPAIEQAILESFYPVLDRSINDAVIVSEQIVRKDFALDPEETKMRMAARYMVCSLTAGMIMVACRNRLIKAISTHLVRAFTVPTIVSISQQVVLAKNAAKIIAADNIELARVFMQKKAIERAISEIDKRLVTDIELRQIARLDGRHYYDPLVKYEAERMPDRLKMKTYGVTPQQMVLYEEFARNIPGFAPLLAQDVRTIFTSPDQSAPAFHTYNSNTHSGSQQLYICDIASPPSFTSKSEYLFHEWISLFHSQQYRHDPKEAFQSFLHQMNVRGILETTDYTTRFFELCTQMCVDSCYRTLAEKNVLIGTTRTKCFYTLDAFVQLAVLMIKHFGKTPSAITTMLTKVLGIVIGVLLQDHEMRRTNFHQMPYHRIFIMLFLELCGLQYESDEVKFEMLSVFCRLLYFLRPTKVSGFCYAWLEIIGHRAFIEPIINTNSPRRCWKMYSELLKEAFVFLDPHVRNHVFSNSLITFHNGVLRILLLLLHDFPDFLCYLQDQFCNVIPLNCIQVRNVILSAVPKSVQVPDPLSSYLRIDMVRGILSAPYSFTHGVGGSLPFNLKKKLGSYIERGRPASFLSRLRNDLRVPQDLGTNYDIQLLNAVVIYVGLQAIKFIQNNRNNLNMKSLPRSPHRDIFQHLAMNFDGEGRYLLFNAIVNQLRYPSNRTFYYSCILLYLFKKANSQMIQELISRVLLERLIINKPHPWGLLVTFIELIKNPIYKFWDLDFVHSTPEIKKLLGLMATVCKVPAEIEPRLG